MKKYFPLLILFFAVPLSALELEYPEIINNGTILINAGVGFAGPISSGERVCPPLTVSLDYALPAGGFPLTLGLTAGFFSEKVKSDQINYWPVAFRIAYHLPFNARRLDTYFLFTIGGMPAEMNGSRGGEFWMGFSAGVRYFFLPHFGAYTELGFDNVQIVTFGLAFNL